MSAIYVVTRNDGVVERVPAGGLLETARHYLLLRPYRQGEVGDQAIVAVYTKAELAGRPVRDDEVGPSDQPAVAVRPVRSEQWRDDPSCSAPLAGSRQRAMSP
jgi:hypothetical protein